MGTYSFINKPSRNQQIVRGDQPNRFAPRYINLQQVTDNGATTTNVITNKAQPTFTYNVDEQLINITYDNTTEKDFTYNGDGTLNTLTITYPDSSTVVKTFNWSGGILQSISIV